MKDINIFVPDKFKMGIRVIMLINRGVNNSNKGSKRWINKIITTNENDWDNAFEKLSLLQDNLKDTNVRMYSCVNSRNIDKAISMFKHKQIDLNEEMKNKFYSNINNSFCSCLMKPENKLSKYFIIDIDTKRTKEADYFVFNNEIEVISIRETVNGHHYICKPFNFKLAENYKTFSVIKDGLILVRLTSE